MSYDDYDDLSYFGSVDRDQDFRNYKYNLKREFVNIYAYNDTKSSVIWKEGNWPDLNFEPKDVLFDPRMRMSDNQIECTMCGLNRIQCPGHFSRINDKIPPIPYYTEYTEGNWLIDPEFYDLPTEREMWYQKNVIFKCRLGDLYHTKHYGFGLKYVDNELVYVGMFNKSMYNGVGTLYITDKSKYSDKFVSKDCYYGNFVDDKMDGYGVYYHNGNILYKGMYKNNLKNGYGELYLYSNIEYRGNFINDKKHGKGKDYNNYGNIIYEGDFFDNKKCGCGIQYHNVKIEYIQGNLDGKIIRGIEGNLLYHYDQYHCQLSKITHNKDILYKGQWKDNIYSGYGTLYNINGSKIYEGEFIAGHQNGLGTLYRPDGTVHIEGTWIFNKLNGYAIYTYIDGTKSTHLYKSGLSTKQISHNGKKPISLTDKLYDDMIEHTLLFMDYDDICNILKTSKYFKNKLRISNDKTHKELYFNNKIVDKIFSRNRMFEVD